MNESSLKTLIIRDIKIDDKEIACLILNSFNYPKSNADAFKNLIRLELDIDRSFMNDSNLNNYA